MTEPGVNRFGIDPDVPLCGLVNGLASVRLRFDQQDYVLPFVSGHQAASALEHAVGKVSKHETAIALVPEDQASADKSEAMRARLDEQLLDIEDISWNLFLDYDVRKNAPQGTA